MGAAILKFQTVAKFLWTSSSVKLIFAWGTWGSGQQDPWAVVRFSRVLRFKGKHLPPCAMLKANDRNSRWLLLALHRLHYWTWANCSPTTSLVVFLEKNWSWIMCDIVACSLQYGCMNVDLRVVSSDQEKYMLQHSCDSTSRSQHCRTSAVPMQHPGPGLIDRSTSLLVLYTMTHARLDLWHGICNFQKGIKTTLQAFTWQSTLLFSSTSRKCVGQGMYCTCICRWQHPGFEVWWHNDRYFSGSNESWKFSSPAAVGSLGHSNNTFDTWNFNPGKEIVGVAVLSMAKRGRLLISKGDPWSCGWSSELPTLHFCDRKHCWWTRLNFGWCNGNEYVL